MKSGLQNRRVAALAIAVVVLAAALIGAFGHAHHADHGAQPCPACVTTMLLVAGVVVAGIVINADPSRRPVAPARIAPVRKRRLASKRAQRAPPSA